MPFTNQLYRSLLAAAGTEPIVTVEEVAESAGTDTHRPATSTSKPTVVLNGATPCPACRTCGSCRNPEPVAIQSPI